MSGLPDQSLLDRLNALKPTSVSLDIVRPAGLSTFSAPSAANPAADSNSATFASSGSAAETSVFRENTLAARLKTLRQSRDAASVDSFSEQPSATPSYEAKTNVKAPGSGLPHEVSKCEGRDDDDPLFYVDNQAVDDILRELAEEGLDGQSDWLAGDSNQGVDEDDLEIPALPEVPQSPGNESERDNSDGGSESADHSRQVEDLLRSLAETKIMHDKRVDHQDASDSDDSDGESINREIRRVLAQAKDELDAAKHRVIDEPETDDDGTNKVSILSGQNAPEQEVASVMSRSRPPRKKNDNETNPLDLPSVPTDFVEPLSPSKNDTSDHLGLPSVPTEDLPKRGDDDDISARLAALRGLQGKATGLGQTDAFGLPSAPSFRPGEEEGGVLKRGHFGHGRRNYTTDDMKAWCIVCLEDATVRCLGCADSKGSDENIDQNNAYCMDCWRDMHVGPAAGFDERGHKRVPLLRQGHSNCP